MNFDTHTHHLRRNALVNLDPVDCTFHPSAFHPSCASSASHPSCASAAILPPCASAVILPSDLFLCSALARRKGPLLRSGYHCSVRIHPWNLTRVTPASLRLLRALAAEPQIRAIGECGLDPLRQNSPDPALSREDIISRQTDLLRIHFELSERWRKPLLLHIVKSYSEIIALRRQWRPTQPWIIHGFRGKPQLASQLLADGFHLSYGQRYNPESLAITPPSRLLRETDDL